MAETKDLENCPQCGVPWVLMEEDGLLFCPLSGCAMPLTTTAKQHKSSGVEISAEATTETKVVKNQRPRKSGTTKK